MGVDRDTKERWLVEDLSLTRHQRIEERLRRVLEMCPSCLGARDKPRTWKEQGPSGVGFTLVKCGHRFHGEAAG